MPNRSNFNVQAVDVTIASGQTKTDPIDLVRHSLVGLNFPSTFDGTTVTFESCDTFGGTYLPVIGSDGNAISFTVAASKNLVLNEAQQAMFRAIRFMKIVAGSSQTTSDTVLKVIKRLIT